MSLDLPESFRDEIRKAQEQNPFIWLWKLTADTTTSAASTFYLARYTTSVVWGGITWRPWNMRIGELRQSTDGDLPTMDLTLDNCTRLLSPWLHEGQGFIDTSAVCYIVNAASLTASPAHFWTMSWRIGRAALEGQAVSFTLEMTNWNLVQLPQDNYSQHRCRWIFGSVECGYVLNNVAAYTTCDKTIGQCKERGVDMRDRGLPKLQPGRFGGFLGIPIVR